MRELATWVLAFGIATGVMAADEIAVTHDKDGKKVSVTIGGKIFTEYLYENKGKPILYPIIGPHGIEMTRNYPMKKGVAGEAKDHPHHQSLHYNHGWVSGKNFWHHRQGEQIRTDEIVKADVIKGEGVIVSRNSWVAGGKTVCTDTTEIHCGESEGGRYIDFKITLHAAAADVVFGDTKEGTMSIRTHPALRLKGPVAKGKAINSEGVTGKAVWRKAEKWVDYWAPIGEHTVGISIFDHPDNPRHPTTWHARDYGLIAVNPFARKHFKAGEGPLTIPAGESVTFAYRFWFREGSHDDATISERYESWGKSFDQKATVK